MAEDVGSGLNERLVVGMGCSGKRRRFDLQAKRELVQACLEPGVSVARMALEHGLNANLLRKWIRQHQRERGDAAAAAVTAGAMPAFLPVVAVNRVESAHPKPGHAVEPPTHAASARTLPCAPALPKLMAELPNGVTLKLECAPQDAMLVTVMIEALGRCDVPARR